MKPPVPTVSVLIPAYNAELTLERCIDSVLHQTIADLEVLIVDDASQDATLDLAKCFAANDARIRVLSMSSNVGVAAARNAAIEASRGSFVAFLDADDEWLPDKLSLQLPLFADPQVGLVYGGYHVIDTNGATTGSYTPDRVATARGILGGNPIGCSTAVVRRTSLGTLRFKTPDARAAGTLQRWLGWRSLHEDLIFWFQLLSSDDRMTSRFVPEPVARYRLSTTSISSSKFRAAYFQWRILRHELGMPLSSSIGSFARYAWTSVHKHAGYRQPTQSHVR